MPPEQYHYQSPRGWLSAETFASSNEQPSQHFDVALSAHEAEEHRYWVEKVKSAQKSSSEIRTQWRDYCDIFGHGTRDPRLHCSAFLQRFFTLRDEGGIPAQPTPAHERPVPEEGRGDPEAHAILTAKVKHAQRLGAEARREWVFHCDAQGLSRNPIAHSCASLRSFLVHLRQGLNRDPFSAPAAFGPSPLSDAIKRMQSTKLKWKHQWDAYCDDLGQGVRDPERHPREFLLGFLHAAEPKPVQFDLDALVRESALEVTHAVPDLPYTYEHNPQAPVTIPFQNSRLSTAPAAPVAPVAPAAPVASTSQYSHLPKWLQPSEDEPMELPALLHEPRGRPEGVICRTLRASVASHWPSADSQPQIFSMRRLEAFSV